MFWYRTKTPVRYFKPSLHSLEIRYLFSHITLGCSTSTHREAGPLGGMGLEPSESSIAAILVPWWPPELPACSESTMSLESGWMEVTGSVAVSGAPLL